MKKLLLTSMISLALLTACDDKPDENTVAEVAQKAEVDSATQAQEAFTALNDATQTYYQTLMTAHPLFKSISYTTESYEKGQDSSTATTKATVILSTEIDGKQSFDLSLKHHIQHDAATLAEGLAAKIDSTLIKPDDLDEEIVPLVDNFSYTTAIKKDHSFTQQISLKPTTITKDGDTIVIHGLEVNGQSTVKQITDGGFGDFEIDFKGITGKDSEGDTLFNIAPTGMNSTYQPNGDLKAVSTAPFVFTEEENHFKIDSFSLKGNAKLNPKYHMFLGDSVAEMRNISITEESLPLPLNIETVTIENDTKINDNEIWSQQSNITVIPSAGLTTMLSQGILDASELKIESHLDNIPVNVLTEYQQLTNEMFETNDDEFSDDNSKRVGKMYNDLKAAGGKMDVKIDLTTTDGQVLVNAKTHIKSDSPVTFEMLESADSPDIYLQAISINIDVSVPAPLLEKTGMQMMVAPFLQKNGDVYQSTISNDSGELLINGMPAPF